MLVRSNQKYVPELKLLWKNVFGDEDGYIDLFFKSQYENSYTFAEFDGDKIISALYLLKCRITVNSRTYNGLYLYAAATDSAYRKRGLMGKLLNEAETFAEENGFDFVSLVPASDYLYTYYERFGFITAMYKSYETLDTAKNPDIILREVTAREYTEKRVQMLENSFLWNEDEMRYALECYNYYDIKAYEVGGVYFIYSKGENEVKELVCSSSDYDNAKQILSSCFDEEAVKIVSPYANTDMNFGMIYPLDSQLKTDIASVKIYMNNALD